MRKIVFFIAVSLILLSTNTADVFAQEEGSAKSTSISFGVKSWHNSWLSWLDSAGSTYGNNVQVLPSDPVFSFIPSATLRHNKLFVSTSYLIAPTFTFPSQTVVGNNSSFDRILKKNKMEAERKELDVAVGYFVHPSIGLTIGYKKIDQEYTITTNFTCTPACSSAQSSTDGEIATKGPTIGLIGSAAISSNIGLYGNIAYGILTTTFDDNPTERPSPYVSSEVGLAYMFSSYFSATLAYRYQNLETGNAINVELPYPDITRGLLFGVNLTI